MIKQLIRRWRRKQRQCDCKYLWPIFLDRAKGDVDKAALAMAIHTNIDPAWKYMTDDQKAEELARMIDILPSDPSE